MVDHFRFSLLYPFFLSSVVLYYMLIIKSFFHIINLSFSSIIPNWTRFLLLKNIHDICQSFLKLLCRCFQICLYLYGDFFSFHSLRSSSCYSTTSYLVFCLLSDHCIIRNSWCLRHSVLFCFVFLLGSFWVCCLILDYKQRSSVILMSCYLMICSPLKKDCVGDTQAWDHVLKCVIWDNPKR